VNSASSAAFPYVCRPAIGGDAPALTALAELGFARWGGYGETIFTWSQLSGVHTWIAETVAGKLVGFVVFGRVQQRPETPPVIDILAVATAAAHQRKGVARALLSVALDEIARWRIAHSVAWLTVAADNQTGQKFFSAAGFVRRLVETPPYPNGAESHRMARPVAPAATLHAPPPAVQIWADPRLG
jgi:ribosomal protein S18 acetylase RimI-like enzyme